MLCRLLRIALVASLALCLPAPRSLADLPAVPAGGQAAVAKDAGDYVAVPSQRPADPDPLPPGTGHRDVPFDFSHLVTDRLPAGVQATSLARWDWREAGIVTPVQDQGSCGSCYAFATLGSLESRVLIDHAPFVNLSENNLKECNYWEANNLLYGGTPWGSCDGGNSWLTANWLTQKGAVLESCDPYVDGDVACRSTCAAVKTLLGFRLIAQDAVPSPDVLKAALQRYGPLYVSMYAGNYGNAWQQEMNAYDGSYVLYYAGNQQPNHGVLLVGYDDSLSHAGGQGAWIIKNSWGSDWGGACRFGTARGYAYVAYGSASIGRHTAAFNEWQDADPNGQLLYYDEAESLGQLGQSYRKDAWGLARYTAPRAGVINRIEWWALDATADVDLYLYDAFDGQNLGSRLWKQENLSYSEPGYFTVAINPPVWVSAGQTIVAVLRIQNQTLTLPLANDREGPRAPGHTYISMSGANGSWTDTGALYGGEVGLRLRFSAQVEASPTPSPTATVSPTPMSTATSTLTPVPTATWKPFTPVAAVYLPIVLKNSSVIPPPQPSATWTSVAVPTMTASPTAEDTATAQPTPSDTPGGPTATRSRTPTVTLTATRTGTPTVTMTATRTTVLPTITPSLTPVAGYTGAYDLPGGPSSLAIHYGTQRLYVARADAADVSAHVLSSLSWITNTPLGENVVAVRVNPVLNRAYASYGNPLFVINTDSHQVVGQIPNGAYGPSELAVNPTNGRVYVADWSVFVNQPDRVWVYDGATTGLLGTVTLGTSPSRERIALAVNTVNGWAYAAWSGDEQVAIIRPDNVVAGRITPGSFAHFPHEPWLAINSRSNRLYLRGSNETLVLNLDNNVQEDTLAGEGLIAVDEGRNRVYVQALSKVYVYNGATNAKVREIPVPGNLSYFTDMAFDPGSNRVFLAAPMDSKIVVLQD